MIKFLQRISKNREANIVSELREFGVSVQYIHKSDMGDLFFRDRKGKKFVVTNYKTRTVMTFLDSGVHIVIEILDREVTNLL